MVLQSLFARIKTGFTIAKASFGVLRSEKWLLVFPLLYGLTWTVGIALLIAGLLVALVGAGIGVGVLEQFTGASDGTVDGVFQVVAILASFGVMFVATAVATFFSAALVHSVGKLFRGEETSIRDGLAGAWASHRTILAWGVVGAIVGLVFQALESRDGLGAQIARGIAGFAWFAMTFFIVPVIVFQDGGLRESMRESVTMFRETWGEVGGISLGIGLIIVPLALIVLATGIGAPLFFLEDPSGVLPYSVAVTVLLLGALVVVHTAATAIAKTALYQYADGGELPAQFDGIDPQNLASRKRGSKSVSSDPSGQQPGQI